MNYDWEIQERASLSNLFEGFFKAFHQIVECRELAARVIMVILFLYETEYSLRMNKEYNGHKTN